MLKHKLFIASSGEEFKTDSLEIKSFILDLNNCFVSRDIYFTPVFSNDLTDAESRKRELAESTIAFFLLSPTTDDESAATLRETYKAARDIYNKTGKPRASIYIKTEHDQLNNAATMLHEQLGNDPEYHSTYTHVDTLKLGILMQIKSLDLPGVDIRLEDGKAWQGSDALLNLGNVESVTGYQNLQSLKQKHAELESRYYAAKTCYAENPDDATTYDEFIKASNARSDAIQEIRDIESQLYHMLEGMYESTSHGKLSKRQIEGYRLVERGLLKEACEVLDFNAIVSECRHREDAVERYARDAQVNVNELLQLKDLKATLLDWEGVDACYKEAVRLEEKYRILRHATFDYAEFLYFQNRHNEAIELGETLRHHYQNQNSGASNDDRSLVYNFLGVAYYEVQEFAKSEEMLNASLAIRCNRVDGSADDISKDIAMVYNNLGNLYYLQHRYEDAIKAHKSALGIRIGLASNDPDKYEEYLGYSYINLGAVYDEVHRYKESAELYLFAQEIFKKLAGRKPIPHENYLSCCYHNLGNSYSHLGKHDEAEVQFKLALEILQKLTGINPDAYDSELAESYSELGRSYFEAKRFLKAEEMYIAAKMLYSKIASGNPAVIEPEYAKCLFNTGELYKEMSRFAEAADAINAAIRLYEKYKESNPAFVEKIRYAQKLLDSVNAAQSRQDGVFSQLTPEEKEVALLLTDGRTKSEIIRKLHLSAADANNLIKSIRAKINEQDEPNPVIDAVAAEYALTKREADMLGFLQRKASNEVIAAELFVTDETVRKYVRALLKKLKVDSRHGVPEWLDAYAESG